MFGNKSSRGSQMVVDALIGPQVVIRGDVVFSGGLYVEGRIEGKVLAEEGAKAMLTLAEQGHIEGEVRAAVVVLSGRLDGDAGRQDKAVREARHVDAVRQHRLHGGEPAFEAAGGDRRQREHEKEQAEQEERQRQERRQQTGAQCFSSCHWAITSLSQRSAIISGDAAAQSSGLPTLP